MKQQCPREWRLGESCGAKLSLDQCMSRSDSFCKTCQDILVKERRIKKEKENLARWKREPDKFRASIEKSESEITMLIRQVNELEQKRRIPVTSRENPLPPMRTYDPPRVITTSNEYPLLSPMGTCYQILPPRLFEERPSPSGVEYRCELKPLSLAADLVEKAGHVGIQNYKNGLIQANRLGTSRENKRKLSQMKGLQVSDFQSPFRPPT